MGTANQVAAEYEAIVQLWDSTVAPELNPLISLGPSGWQDYTLVYVFDRFCHFIVVEIGHKGWSANFPPLSRGDKAKRQGQFSDFLRQYLPRLAPTPEQFRQEQYQFSNRLASNRRPTDPEVMEFFLKLHAVSAGSYSWKRQDAVEAAAASERRRLLELLNDQQQPLRRRIEQALTSPPSGRKIKGLGPSTIAEIPGWLSVHRPKQLPIVNGKFVMTLDHLGIYTAAGSCFGTSSS